MTAVNFEIAPDYTVADWGVLTLDEANVATDHWDAAFAIFDARIRSRFIEPAQCLIDLEAAKKRGTYGFAVLAIDFLIVETIQGFKMGVENHNGRSEALIKGFLTTWSSFTGCVPSLTTADQCAKEVYKRGRCALHHSGSTDSLKVVRSGPMFVFHPSGEIEINRTALHQELTKAFDNYLDDLRQPQNINLRINFKTKMGRICSS